MDKRISDSEDSRVKIIEKYHQSLDDSCANPHIGADILKSQRREFYAGSGLMYLVEKPKNMQTTLLQKES